MRGTAQQDENGCWSANFGNLCIRKWHTIIDETLTTETGQSADGEPLHRVVIAAVFRNPYASRFEPDLSGAISDSVQLGREFGRRLSVALGNRAAEGYGKSCIVGTAGEYEHGNAFLTTEFANPIRDALGGALAWIPSTGKIGGPQTTVDVPFAHKDALYVRSHYDTISVALGDGPLPNEIAILFGVSTRGRLHARLGGLRPSDIARGDGLR